MVQVGYDDRIARAAPAAGPRSGLAPARPADPAPQPEGALMGEDEPQRLTPTGEDFNGLERRASPEEELAAYDGCIVTFGWMIALLLGIGIFALFR